MELTCFRLWLVSSGLVRIKDLRLGNWLLDHRLEAFTDVFIFWIFKNWLCLWFSLLSHHRLIVNNGLWLWLSLRHWLSNWLVTTIIWASKINLFFGLSLLSNHRLGR
jgi:hypothetical protein